MIAIYGFGMLATGVMIGWFCHRDRWEIFYLISNTQRTTSIPEPYFPDTESGRRRDLRRAKDRKAYGEH